MRLGAVHPLGAEAGWLPWRPRRVIGRPGEGPLSPLPKNEVEELEALFRAVEVDSEEAPVAKRLALRLQPLVHHGVPPRCVEPAPAPRAARLRFADGTTVIVKSAVPGDIGELALALSLGPVRLTACQCRPDGFAYLLLKQPRHSRDLCLRVLGLDQPD